MAGRRRPGRRTRTLRASEGEAERPRRGAERCTRPTAPAAPGRGGHARARGACHAPVPLPALPVRAPAAPAQRGLRNRPGSGSCAARGGGQAPAARRRPQASPSPGMVCPVGNAHASLLSHQHKVLPHCGESLEARDDSEAAHSFPNSPESRFQRLVVAPSFQGLRCRSSSYEKLFTRTHRSAHTHASIRADVSGMHLSWLEHLSAEPRVQSDSWGSFGRSQCMCITNSPGRGARAVRLLNFLANAFGGIQTLSISALSPEPTSKGQSGKT